MKIYMLWKPEDEFCLMLYQLGGESRSAVLYARRFDSVGYSRLVTASFISSVLSVYG